VVALGALLLAYPGAIVLPGASRPATAADAARAGELELPALARAELAAAFPGLAPLVPRRRASAGASADVILVMGLPGSGKSTRAERLVGEGFERLNRDEAGGSLKQIAGQLDRRLAEGARRLVLDNTYTTRAARAQVLEVAARHGARVRGVWLDTPLAEAQVNLVWRMLEAHGRLLEPHELGRRNDPTTLSPLAQHRMRRDLEEPRDDEGFDVLERVAFARTPRAGATQAARLVADDVLADLAPVPGTCTLVFGWAPPGAPARANLAQLAAAHAAEVALCPHAGGPPRCWCRPPLPGLVIAFARRHAVDLRCATLYGHSRAHRELALAVGARFVDCPAPR
jgi:adenylate kinase family enzyme